MHYLHKLQEAKKHNGHEGKNLVGVNSRPAPLPGGVRLVRKKVGSLLKSSNVGTASMLLLRPEPFVLSDQGALESTQGNRPMNHSNLRCLP